MLFKQIHLTPLSKFFALSQGTHRNKIAQRHLIISHKNKYLYLNHLQSIIL